MLNKNKKKLQITTPLQYQNLTERKDVEEKLKDELKSILLSFENDFIVWTDKLKNQNLGSNIDQTTQSKRVGNISFKDGEFSKYMADANSTQNKLREIESGALYTTTTQSIRERNKLKYMLDSSK